MQTHFCMHKINKQLQAEIKIHSESFLLTSLFSMFASLFNNTFSTAYRLYSVKIENDIWMMN
jgi:hypothetical protein